MDDKRVRAEARKKALRELLEGAGMIVIAVVCKVLAGDFNFVEGVTTRSESRTYIYLIVAAVALLVIGAVYLVMGLIHLIRPKKDGGQGR